MKRLLTLTLALILALALSATVFANTRYITDDSGLLTADEAEVLEMQAAGIHSNYEFDVVILTTDHLAEKTAEAYADDCYDQSGYEQDGIMFLVSIEERDWAFSAAGLGSKVFTDYGTAYIAEMVVPYLSDGDYYGAFSTFLKLADTFLHEAATKMPYDTNNTVGGFQYTEDSPPRSYSERFLTTLPLALLFAAVIALLVTMVMKSKMNNANPQRLAHNYISQFNLKTRQDIFLYSHVSRIKKPDPPQGSGGTRTHKSSGGVSHSGRSGKF